MQNELSQAVTDAVKLVDDVMEAAIPTVDGLEQRLFEAMRYSAFAGGKRLRPFLVIEGAKMFGVPVAYAVRAGAAVEMIHTYSLIHDDLPAMDNAELRRGRPTAHRAFDEATAILAGDALQALAFEMLADPATHPDPDVRCRLVASLARNAGGPGMCGGQMFDLLAENKSDLSLADSQRLQSMKTGALFAYSCEAGGILGGADAPQLAALSAYARDLGLAFQIADDILDATGDEEEVGKTVGADAEAGKTTFVSLLGLDGARAEAAKLADQAAEHLKIFGERARLLQLTAQFVVQRRA
ncbi:MAG: polyprenyl synthetase family protein [Alphaproteobacteria bacterium]|nr:polyprenyl synthetase family protein [Alphaproteobacteria bacterium]